MKLRISNTYRNLFPAPTKETYDSMKDDIKKHGQRIPIYHNKGRTILDGYTRYKIVKSLKRKPITELKDFKTKEQEIDFIMSMNLQRRDLNDFQRFEAYEYLYKELRKTNQKYREGSVYRGKSPIGWTSRILSKKTGVTEGSIARIVFVKKHGRPTEIAKIRNGKMKLTTIYNRVQGRTKPKTTSNEIPWQPDIKTGQRILCPECGGTGKITI